MDFEELNDERFLPKLRFYVLVDLLQTCGE